MLPIRKCGAQGFECGAQGLGCMGMSGLYGGYETDEAQEEAMRVLQKASEYKGIMLDTSDAYGPFTNEQLIGKAIAGKREMFIIATKCGPEMKPQIKEAFVETSTEGVAEAYSFNSSPEHVKKACQGIGFSLDANIICDSETSFVDSLDRLGIDCIDLYYLHRYDMKTPIEETMQAFKELIEEGKIKYAGLSEVGVATLRRAHAVCPVTAYQLEYSIFERGAEEEIIPACRELGIGIVPYGPMGAGLLTGGIKSKDDIPVGDIRHMFPRFQEHLDDNLRLADIIKEIADSKGCTIAQLALAWVHAQGDDVFPIPGTKRLSRFEENLGALEIQLSEEESSKLAEISDKVKGGRTMEEFKALTHQGQKEYGF